MNKQHEDIGLVEMPIKELSPVILGCLADGGEVVLTITGNSMSPFVRHKRDQVVLTAVTDSAALLPGAVPLYRRKTGQYVLHRIVEKDDGTCRVLYGDTEQYPTAGGGIRYTMLGDAQWVTEPGIRPEQIVGCATAFIRKGKRWECDSKAYLRNRLWWHRLLPLRSKIMYAYRLPGRVMGRLRREWNELRNEWKRK